MASEYSQLSSKLRKRIDCAFDVAANASPRGKRLSSDRGISGRAYKRQRVAGSVPSETKTAPEVEAGGFLLDTEEAGGFLVEDTASSERREIRDETPQSDPGYIRLADIPAALQSVDLPPDDEDVLSTFKNAASGWGDPSNNEHGVKLEDWREVCAVLLAAREERPAQVSDTDMAGMTDGGGGFLFGDDGNAELDLLDESVTSDEKDEDFQVDEENDEGDEAARDDSDYEVDLLPPHKSRRKTRQRRRRGSSDSPSSDGSSRPMTARQKIEARRAFGLFFPDVAVDSDELSRKKIMIRDIKRVADLLSEKLRAEEIIEMLGAFSTSADNSVSLNDFERMAMEARLV